MNVADYPQHVAWLQRATEGVLAEHHYDALVLCSGAPQERNPFDDQYWPLSPTPAYLHWLPLVEPDAYVVVRPGKRPQLVRTAFDDLWETLVPPESDHFWSHFEVSTALPGKAAEVLPRGKVAVITRDAHGAPAGDVNPPALLAALDKLRTIKTPYELACLDEAQRRGVAGHRAALARFHDAAPASELELHFAFLAATRQDDAWTPYKNIVAFGKHAATLHHIAYETSPITGDGSLLLDAGAKCLCYGSDITRTHVRGARARVFGDPIARIDRMQQEICRRALPGRPYEELHDETHRLLADAMIDLGLGKGSAAELVDAGVTRAFLPHGLGHSLGLVTHDVGMRPCLPRAENRFLRNTSVIEIGQVFTIEPGLYFIAGLLGPLRAGPHARLVDWKLADELAPFGGVRIEDDVVVQAGGIRNLTREAFAA